MKIFQTNLNGVFEIKNQKFEDYRGIFTKTFHANTFESMGLDADFKESFYSISKKGVLRGMHYQLPPYEYSKLVYVTDGSILDVVVDVRKDSATFGQYFSTELSKENAKSLYISKGFAHGFFTLSDSATVIYLTSTVHSPQFDSGIHWNSFDFDWPLLNPVISERDKNLPPITSIK